MKTFRVKRDKSREIQAIDQQMLIKLKSTKQFSIQKKFPN